MVTLLSPQKSPLTSNSPKKEEKIAPNPHVAKKVTKAGAALTHLFKSIGQKNG